MFVLALTCNLVKRHPKCQRLLHRRAAPLTLAVDPYREDEEDPMATRALKSSLWELEVVMRNHCCSGVRSYAKVLKTDFIRKTAFFKLEDITQVDPLDMLLQEVKDVDNDKEGDALKKNLLMKHG